MSAPEVVVVDYEIGNLLSVQRALEFCGARVIMTADPETICKASRVVLPGVGAFGKAMAALHEYGLVDVVRTVARQGTPLLGICLGMQLLMDESEEFTVTAGLGLIPGRVIPVPASTAAGEPQKIPHIGWNRLLPRADAGWAGSVLEDIHPGDSVYFVHSFMAAPVNDLHRIAICRYGDQPVTAFIQRENVSGCQFHPEKSGAIGLRILQRFVST